MSEHRVARRATAVAVTLWLAGWIPSIVYSWRVGGGPQFYAVWIVLAPLALFCALGVVTMLAVFYQWALGKESQAEREARIRELERELGIH